MGLSESSQKTMQMTESAGKDGSPHQETQCGSWGFRMHKGCELGKEAVVSLSSRLEILYRGAIKMIKYLNIK